MPPSASPRLGPRRPPDYERLRELTRERVRVVKTLQRLENRMGEGTGLEIIQAQWKKQQTLLERHREALEAEIEKLTHGSVVLCGDGEMMKQLCGIAAIVSSTLQADLGDPRGDSTARRYVARSGICPETKDSGTSVRQAHMSRRGSPLARRVLNLSAMAAIRAKEPNRFREYYRRRAQKGLAPKSALLAVARKMCWLRSGA